MRIDEDNRRFKRVSRLFFAWQEKKEENWLIEISKKGWHLDDTGFLTYIFRKGELKDIIYRLDFKIIRNENILFSPLPFHHNCLKKISALSV